MAKFSKKCQLSAISKTVFSKMKQGFGLLSLLFSYFKTLFSKTPHGFQNFHKFCHSKISTYTAIQENAQIPPTFSFAKNSRYTVFHIT